MEESKRPAKVIFVITTDGMENAFNYEASKVGVEKMYCQVGEVVRRKR